MEGIGEIIGDLQVSHGLKGFLITCLNLHLLWRMRSLLLLFFFLLFLFFLWLLLLTPLLLLLLTLTGLNSDCPLGLPPWLLGAFHIQGNCFYKWNSPKPFSRLFIGSRINLSKICGSEGFNWIFPPQELIFIIYRS